MYSGMFFIMYHQVSEMTRIKMFSQSNITSLISIITHDYLPWHYITSDGTYRRLPHNESNYREFTCVTWMTWVTKHLKSSTTLQLFQAYSKINTKSPRYWQLVKYILSKPLMWKEFSCNDTFMWYDGRTMAIFSVIFMDKHGYVFS